MLGTLGIAIALLIASIAFACWRLRRREDREIERFEQRPRVDGDEFLDAMGIDRSSEFAEIALAARARLAELGCVPPDSIAAADRFYPDLEKLPFYDSIDFLELVFTLEKELDVLVSQDDQAAIGEGVMKGTVADVVRHAVRIYREQRRGKTG